MYGEQARENITSTIPADKVNTICDALRALLEARGLEKYVETILTTHVCKIPPDYESGLRVLLQLQGMSTFIRRLLLLLLLLDGFFRLLICKGVADHPEIVEDAIKYIIFLSDVNKLYDVALGMYNFQLVLMIAQYSQKASPPPPQPRIFFRYKKKAYKPTFRIRKNTFLSCENSELLINGINDSRLTIISKDEKVRWPTLRKLVQKGLKMQRRIWPSMSYTIPLLNCTKMIKKN